MSAIGLRHALRADRDTVVDVWVDAFSGDPFLRWVAPDNAQYAAYGRAWLGFTFDLCIERGHTYLDRSEAVAIAWIPPDVTFVGPDDIAFGRGIIAAHAGEERADQAFETIVQARDHGIEAPHWTLQYIGARSASHGRGLGGEAARPMLDVCDREALPCGLISTNGRNVTFYERLGFRVAAEIPTPDGRAVLRPMHR